ncbi:MAG: hypothetical protein K2H85_05110, partial [Allobaculum sp.]|nr:hypothetical protein [Allobaculum sp.]
MKWVDDTPLSQMNKCVVNWLSNTFKNEIRRTYGDDIDNGYSQKYQEAVRNNLMSIISDNNFSYNISTGDVFYLLNLLAIDFIDSDKRKMLLFIRSLYSILLYEHYDIVTFELENKPESDIEEQQIRIYRKDPQFSAANDLQKILNGAYFNYVPGELLPTDQTKTFHFDTRVIKGAITSKDKNTNPETLGLADLLKECKTIIDSSRKDPSLEISKTDKDKIRLAEFFILTISRSIPNNDIDSFYSGSYDFRHESNPAYLSDFNSSTGYYVFDIMAPFANLANPRFCYERYYKMCDGLYEFVINHDFSLLRELMDTAVSNRNNIDSSSPEGKVHALMSDAIIRNGEILTAIFENAKHSRFENHWLTGLEAIGKFYDKIKESG